MNLRLVAFVLCVLVLVVPSVGLDRARYDVLNKQAREAAKQQDWKGLRAALLALGQEMPGPTPIYMLRMASVEARLGNTDAALHWMSRYTASGLTYDTAGDDDLRPLISDPGYKNIAAEMERNARPVANAELVCTLPLPDLMPEDITFEPSSGGFVTSSVQHHRLYRAALPKKADQQCSLDEVSLEDDAKRWPTLAVSLDTKRNLMWMTASAMPGFSGFAQSDSGKAALFAIDKSTWKTVRRFDLDTGKPAVLGDMTVAGDGRVYVTDSLGGGVYRVQGDPRTARLEKITEGLFSPQTPVLATDGKRLFVADYSMGIAVINLANRVSDNIVYLPHPENIAVTGLDGLYLSANSLIGIQNGTEPERIMRFLLNASQTEIISASVIEQGQQLGEATHAVLVKGNFYVSANVGWDKVDDRGQLKAGQKFTAPKLLRFGAGD